MATTLEELVFKFEADMSQLSGQLKNVERQIEGTTKKVEKAAAGIGKSFSRIFAFGAVVSAGSAILRYSGQIEQAADAIQDTAEAANISTDALQTFRFAAEQAGGSAEGMDIAVRKLNKSIGEARSGSKEDLNLFRALGLEDLIQNGASNEKIIRGIADAMRQIKDPAQAAAVATRLMGKTSDELVSLFQQGSGVFDIYAQKLDDIGGRIAPEVIKANADMADATKRLHVQATAFFNNLDTFFNRAVIGAAAWAQDSIDYITQVGKAFEDSGLMGAFVGEGARNDNAAPPAPDVNKFGLGPLGAGVAPRQKKVGDLSNLLGGGGGGRDKAADEIKRQQEAIEALIDDLRFENSLVGVGEEQQAVMNNLRQLGASATEEQRVTVEALTRDLSQAQKQQENLAELERFAIDIKRQFGDQSEATAHKVEMLNRALAQGYINAQEFTAAMEDAQMTDKTREMAEEWSNIKDQAMSGLADTLVDVASNIDDASARMAAFGEEILKAIAKMLILKAIEAGIDAIFSGGAGDLTGGAGGLIGRASGGPVNAGTPYRVGEMGPEVFVPNVSGAIVPHNRTAGGNVITIHSNVSVPGGTSRAEFRQMLQTNNAELVKVITAHVDDKRRRGLSYLQR